ncbi:protein ATP6V1FNB-like [Aethina tumida]|uniref:protein ATP6V1FNB-like n=1 Tax=Aethina tumida TaxID=116153 RepID=UPI00096AF8C5|nr:protein ATP6V1FNB-like [Aethina tumida]
MIGTPNTYHLLQSIVPKENEQRLKEIARQKQKQKDKFTQDLMDNNLEPIYKTAKPPVIKDDENDNIILDFMKPVDPEVKKVLYSSYPEARHEYLKLRYLPLPEDRYYFPEASNFVYGWHMWHERRQYVGFGRQPIIKNSFYRRNGVERDPDWYKEPHKMSPTTCGNL